jgi:predicted Ser/Thr protein kinase
VFLGALDTPQSYFLHGAGEIQHMLLMAWAGEPLTRLQWENERTAVKRSIAKIFELGVIHGDVRRPNTLWNLELNRVLIIDFHKSKLLKTQIGMPKRRNKLMENSPKRLRLTV